MGRLNANCNPLSSQKTTKVGVNITSAEVSIWKRHVELDNLGIFFNATVPCPSFVKPTTPPNPSPTPNTKMCSSHPACKGLLGDCCPNEKGTVLDCCSSTGANGLKLEPSSNAVFV